MNEEKDSPQKTLERLEAEAARQARRLRKHIRCTRAAANDLADEISDAIEATDIENEPDETLRRWFRLSSDQLKTIEACEACLGSWEEQQPGT